MTIRRVSLSCYYKYAPFQESDERRVEAIKAWFDVPVSAAPVQTVSMPDRKPGGPEDCELRAQWKEWISQNPVLTGVLSEDIHSDDALDAAVGIILKEAMDAEAKMSEEELEECTAYFSKIGQDEWDSEISLDELTETKEPI